jgi:hypothetical protein
MIGMMMAVHAIEHLDRHCGMEWQACSLDQIEKLFAINPPNVAFGVKRTSMWQQLVRKILHAAGHRYLDGGDKAPGRAWLGRDHLDPDNEDGRHDKGNGQRMAHGDVPSVTDM